MVQAGDPAKGQLGLVLDHSLALLILAAGDLAHMQSLKN